MDYYTGKSSWEVRVQPKFWKERWSEGRIGFHGTEPHVSLQEHWGSLQLPADSAKVLVPLCGKSVDLWWLAERGLSVTGVELAEQACEQLFSEHGVTPQIQENGAHREWTGGGIRVLQGDIFDLEERGWDAVWDRAALIALPAPLRQRYAAHLTELLDPGAQMLLVALVYPHNERGGPPFAIDAEQVRLLYNDAFSIAPLASTQLDADERPPWPISWLRRDVWALRRRRGSG